MRLVTEGPVTFFPARLSWQGVAMFHNAAFVTEVKQQCHMASPNQALQHGSVWPSPTLRSLPGLSTVRWRGEGKKKENTTPTACYLIWRRFNCLHSLKHSHKWLYDTRGIKVWTQLTLLGISMIFSNTHFILHAWHCHNLCNKQNPWH